jgi:lysophospholipase L1-like esterase
MGELRHRANRKLQVVGTRGAVHGGQANSGGTNLVGYTRFRTFLGDQDVHDLRLLYANIVAGGAGVETPAPNDFLQLAATIEDGTSYIPLLFNGVKRPAMGADGRLLSDKSGLDVAGNAGLWIRTGVQVNTGLVFPRTSFFAITGEAGVEDDAYNASAFTAVMEAAGAIGTPTGGAATGIGYIPTAVLGYTEAFQPAVALFGDSIAAGTPGDNSDATTGARGMLARALWNSAKTSVVPYSVLARASERSLWLQGFSGVRRKSLLDYHTDLICNYGSNCIAAGDSLATIQGYLTAIWRAAKRRGLRVWQVLILPRTDSGNTTPASGFTAGGTRSLLNAWILTQVGNGLLDGVLNPNTVAESPTTPGLWATGIMSDGIHPNTVGAPLIADSLRPTIDATIRRAA